MSPDPLTPLLERARQVVDDRRLSAVARFKEENPGWLAVGYLPIYVPRPWLEAMGCLPVAVFGGGDQVEIIRGDSYFQSYICHIPRSTLELALAKDLDVLDGMLFPSICDVIRNLGGMWRMLFPERYAAYLDLPQDFDPELGGVFYEGELRRIGAELAERGARPLEAGALARAVHEENERRAVLAEMDALRRREPWRLRASEAYLVTRAGTQMLAREHTRFLREVLAAVAERPARLLDNARVVMVGSFCEQPPLALLRTLEKAGCDIVDDDLQLGLRMLEGAIPLAQAGAGDGLDLLVRAFLEQGVETASRFVPDHGKGRELVEKVRRSEADGVLFAAASFCDPALLDQPMLEAALDAAGIPHTSLKFAENTGQFQTIREQAGAFSDSVKLWGVA